MQGRTDGFRADVEGLRAVAVVLVMLAHAGVPGLGGGFIGVDVFFVISGFLITGLLVREMRETRRISLVRFWARRAKRLLPASITVLVATLVLTVLLVPSPRWSSIGGDVIAAALYVVNWRFAEQSVSYLNADAAAASPVQHYWSLAVEEQFYLVWPLLILLCAEAARQLSVRLRSTLVVGLLLVVVPSFVWSMIDTASSPEPAYFVTTTRLWELGAGALVALYAPLWQRSTRGAATMLAWGGFACLLLAALTVSTDTAWPGYQALLPVAATAAVIVGGFRARSSGPLRVLGLPFMQRTGALSYGLYLWHWPLLAVATARWGELSWPVGLLVVAASALPAWATYTLVENPVRRAALLSRVPRLALAVGAACTAVGVVAGLSLGALARAQIDHAPASDVQGAAAAAEQLPEPAAALAGGSSHASGSAGAGPRSRPGSRGAGTPSTPSAASSPSARPSPAAKPKPVSPWAGSGPAIKPALLKPAPPNLFDLTPTSISPDPIKAADDTPKRTCIIGVSDTAVERCDLGDRSGRMHLAVVGDSKADQWIDQLDTIARQHHWRLDVYTKAGCVLSSSAVQRGQQPYRECSTWRTQVLRQITGAQKPDAVLVSGQESRAYAHGRATDAQMVTAYVGQWKALQAKGIRVVALTDVPTVTSSLIDCVSGHRSSPNSSCTFRKNNGLGTQSLTSAARATHVPLITLNDWVCPTANGRCPSVIGNVLVYRSGSHVTATYASTLTEVLRARLVTALG
ncbi:hypothetical protein VV01_17520 [Luteipulveratus halotolerans]|uniref:Acyltransferase n=2 Tax=Luteipulveratus halotolerans TaxID=1631356 RepID=A0A0L6CLE5_9MICO|nr:hypothetical protein VV01_17520 [Luteipulveratus halotolerans]